jgi:hypothetical protein
MALSSTAGLLSALSPWEQLRSSAASWLSVGPVADMLVSLPAGRPGQPPMEDLGSRAWRGPARLMKTVAVGTPEPERAGWPAHLPVGALRVVRWSARYDQTVIFYRDIIGLPVLETFTDSYGLDGTILGLPGNPVHLEIVRLRDTPDPAQRRDQLVFYLPDAAAQERITARLAAAGIDPVAQIDYWQDNGGVTYQDPDGREVVFASWIYRPDRDARP